MNYKKTFCNNGEFLGNPAHKRPHLHCGTNYLSFKKTNGNHIVLSEQGNCERTNAAFDIIKVEPIAFDNYEEIYRALVAYHQAGCPNQ